MEKHEIQKLRELPIEGVAERLGLGVSRHKSLCPFHDDHHASLSFSPGRNTFRCFVCGAKGGTIDLVMRRLGLGFPGACRWLADSHNVILTEWKPAAPPSGRKTAPFDPARYIRHFEHPWLSPEARQFLFAERRLNPAVVRWCRLTSWTDQKGTHWLEIPYFSADGKLIGVQNRNLDYRKTTREKSPTEPTEKSSAEPKRNSDGECFSNTELTEFTEKSSAELKRNSDGECFPNTELTEFTEKNPSEFRISSADNKNSVRSVRSVCEKNSAGETPPRFRFPYGARCSVYNLPVLARLRQGDELYITEGASDCWAMLSAGRKAVAIPSATLLGTEDKALLQTLANERSVSFHMYPDRDAPGERLFLQLREVLPGLVHHQLPPSCKDFAEHYLSTQPGADNHAARQQNNDQP